MGVDGVTITARGATGFCCAILIGESRSYGGLSGQEDVLVGSFHEGLDMGKALFVIEVMPRIEDNDSTWQGPLVLIDVLFIREMVKCVVQRVDLLSSKASHEHILGGFNICFPLTSFDMEHTVSSA